MDPREVAMELMQLRRDLATLNARMGGIPVRCAIGGGGKGSDIVAVSITGVLGTGGMYSAFEMKKPTASIETTGLLTSSKIGVSVAPHVLAVVCNVCEQGQTGHLLLGLEYPIIGWKSGVKTTDGKNVVYVNDIGTGQQEY